jgi:ATP/maltotriose-dependent transcriptional regulator MalT
MTTILVSVGINLVLMGFFYILINKKITHQKSAPVLLDQIQSELDRMVVELNRTADRNIDLIEEKIRTLTGLIADADRRISILKKETDKYTRTAGTYSNVRPVNVGVRKKTDVPSQPVERPVEAEKKQEVSKETDESEPRGKRVGKRERVVELYRQGISTEIIASRLDATVAEIELIISMTGADK